MKTPDDLLPGDRVTFTGFRDFTKDPDRFCRSATFTRRLRCGYEFRFDAGYTETWSRQNLMYALNDIPVAGNVPIRFRSVKEHVEALMHG